MSSTLSYFGNPVTRVLEYGARPNRPTVENVGIAEAQVEIAYPAGWTNIQWVEVRHLIVFPSHKCTAKNYADHVESICSTCREVL